MQWFKHDTNAHTDAKIEKVLMRYGADGYALYWYCLELIAGKVNRQNITFELEHDSELLGFKLKIDSLRVEEIMRYMISLGLFEQSGDTITCLKLAKRLDSSMTGSPEMRRIITSLHHDDVMTRHDDVMTLPDSVSTDKNRREEKRINNRAKTSRFCPPTVKEVAEYCQSRNNTVDAEEFINHYQANGWMRGKTKIKDWKACVRTWEKNQKANGARPTSAYGRGGV